MTEETPTPDNPNIQRLGKVERKLRSLAKAVEKEPGEFLESIINDGTSQTEVAEALGCTRQAVAAMASRYGLEFPGVSLDLDDLVTEKGFETFAAYVDQNWGNMTQEEMAEDVGVSLSTLKRRIRTIQSERED